jgi:hypothetical protein
VGLHGQRNLQESAGPVFVSLQISHHASARNALQINGLRVVQGGLAARGELGKLGVDAADLERFMRAVQSGDEDLVALFLEAGAIDPNQPDASGRRAIDLAQKPAVRELLQSM